mmetsp:Transcript_8293/g.31197  ORF Transcript_8293/g.31197 Transcript_8293/m.31197 type:complete len:236 (+) Transcript_8293:468-1175(+)
MLLASRKWRASRGRYPAQRARRSPGTCLLRGWSCCIGGGLHLPEGWHASGQSGQHLSHQWRQRRSSHDLPVLHPCSPGWRPRWRPGAHSPVSLVLGSDHALHRRAGALLPERGIWMDGHGRRPARAAQGGSEGRGGRAGARGHQPRQPNRQHPSATDHARNCRPLREGGPGASRRRGVPEQHLGRQPPVPQLPERGDRNGPHGGLQPHRKGAATGELPQLQQGLLRRVRPARGIL